MTEFVYVATVLLMVSAGLTLRRIVAALKKRRQIAGFRSPAQMLLEPPFPVETEDGRVIAGEPAIVSCHPEMACWGSG